MTPKLLVKENLETTHVRNASYPKPVGVENINHLYLFHFGPFHSNTPFVTYKTNKGFFRIRESLNLICILKEHNLSLQNNN